MYVAQYHPYASPIAVRTQRPSLVYAWIVLTQVPSLDLLMVDIRKKFLCHLHKYEHIHFYP